MGSSLTTSELSELRRFLSWRERADLDAALTGREAPPPFPLWLPRVSPTWTWTWDHLRVLQSSLEKVARGELLRLMVFIPPRHGKTECGTVRFPVHCLELDPGLKVIVGAYNQSLANKFSRKARKIAAARLPLSKERKAVEDWETAAGGGFRAVGVGAGITGQGGDLILIDDPVKNREEAESRAYRDRVWEWYTDDLYTRCEPGGAIVLTMTRWHEDDLAGRILASEDGPSWTVIRLPAVAEADDPLGRPEGAALCPARFDEVVLAKIAQVLGSYSFGALYQGNPRPREGGFFKAHLLEIVRALPSGCRFVRYWDKAATAGGGDFSCGVLMARHEWLFFVVDVVRGQWSALERERAMAQTAALDRQRYGDEVAIWAEQEPGSGGKESAEATERNLAGFWIRTERVTGSKAVRAMPLAAQVEAGNVKLLEGAWNAGYIERVGGFPAAKNDDEVDASAGSFAKLAEGGSLILFGADDEDDDDA